MAELKTWSYSSATTFEKCPKQYYHLYVAKDVKTDSDSQHLIYGNEVHKAAEEYIGKGKKLPEKFNMFQPTLDRLNQIPGEKLCEYKIGLTKELAPCSFFDQNVWWRGVVDLLILDKDKHSATVIDYKTGKNSQYADTRQLSLLSVGIFKHFPDIEKIKAGLVFLVSKELLKEDYKQQSIEDMFDEWGTITKRMTAAHDSNVFNAVPNFACRSFCPVQSCPHHGK